MEPEPAPNSRINPEKPGTIAEYPAVFSTKINPTLDLPSRDPRYAVSSWSLGRIESLAKARFEIKRLSNDNLENWKGRSEHIYSAIAQSVRASSAIEGEEVYVQEAEIPKFPLSSKNDDPSLTADEIERRHRAGVDIYDTYIWALNAPSDQQFDIDFIMELHRRMFHNAMPDKAGKIRTENLTISGGGYRVDTVPWRSVRKVLTTLADRFDFQKNLAETGRYSIFMLAGEFVVDYLAIHPFEDGNGRLARLLSTYFLEKAGYHFPRFYPLDFVIRERNVDYYKALFDSQCNWMTEKEDLTPWMEFYIESVELQFKRSIEYLRKQQLGEKTKIASR